jgi:outer membrane protein OmpA-like peptidoglycan-associated protein
MRILSVIVASGLLVSLNAFAGSSQDAAYDMNNKFVVDQNNQCVRTKWMSDNDICMKAHIHVSKEERTIYFDFDSAKLKDSAKSKLISLANIINSSSKIKKVSLLGYTDQFGSDLYNMGLSEQRVGSVAKFLGPKIHVNISPEKVVMEGLGKAAPEAKCSDIKIRNDRIKCMADERRVEVLFKYELEHEHK